MPRTFDVNWSPVPAYVRRMAFAAEIIDAVTLEPVRSGIGVTARGLSNKPFVNGSGMYVWLAEGNARPSAIVVDTGDSPYEPTTQAVPPAPALSMRIALAPRPGYALADGVTALRGTLIERRVGPRTPIAGAQVWLRWIDTTPSTPALVDVTPRSSTRSGGDFAVFVHLAPDQTAGLDTNGSLRVRLGARFRSTTRTSEEFALLQGRVFERSAPFVWNEFQLSP
jgi:hypothetical protein